MTGGVALTGLLVALALLTLAPPPRRVRRPARRSDGRRPRRGPRRRPRARELDPGLLVSEVAMRLRAGAEPTRAWTQTLHREGLQGPDGPGLDGSGVPVALLTLADRLGAGRGRRGGRGRQERPDRAGGPGGGGGPGGRGGGGLAGGPVGPGGAAQRPGEEEPGRAPRLGDRAQQAATRGALAGVVVACRVTHATGAPLAEILDRSAGGIAESARAAGARTVALAGPRATGRLLGWLPVVGLVLGAAVGADPLEVLLDGGLGTALLAVGLVLLAVGWWWVLREERRAETEQA